MPYYLYLILGILPSIVWLLFFLREDANPEPNRIIIKVFLLGILAGLLSIIFECLFFDLTSNTNLSRNIGIFINIFIGVALVEEYFKYLVVRKGAINDPDFDEPVDAMLYMIIAGLGFAALENTLVFLGFTSHSASIPIIIPLAIFRFVGATFLHALASGLIGFFLAMSFLKQKHKYKLIVVGLSISTFLHGLYNFSIMELAGKLRIMIIAVLLLGMAVIVLLAFKKLRSTASICKIKIRHQ
jgi:protease PrsW